VLLGGGPAAEEKEEVLLTTATMVPVTRMYRAEGAGDQQWCCKGRRLVTGKAQDRGLIAVCLMDSLSTIYWQ